jgi:hypothetical protein
MGCGWLSYKVAFHMWRASQRLSTSATSVRVKKPLLLKNEKELVLPRPKRINGTLYQCGWNTGRLAQHLFDDYLPQQPASPMTTNDTITIQVPTFRRSMKTTTSMDVLVMGGNSCGRGMNIQWLERKFLGKILIVNGESYEYPDSSTTTCHNCFTISAQETSLRNMYVPYAAIALIGLIPPTMWPILTMNNRSLLLPSNLKNHHNHTNTREHFLVYASNNCIEYRNQVALALSQIGMIHHGVCRPPLLNESEHNNNNNNFTALAAPHQGRDQWPENYKIFTQYRFCLVLENRLHAGYITEKILNAFLGGCIPIWYGTPDVWDVFNRDAFLYVNVTDPDAINALVRTVRYLEHNRTAYQEVVQRSIVASSQALERYFSMDDSIGKGRLKHDIRVMMGLEDEQYHQLYS